MQIDLSVPYILIGLCLGHIQYWAKKDSEKTHPFFVIATNFNETSVVQTHIRSDYFPLLLL